MAYEWNRLWSDPENLGNEAYIASIRRMIVASINWIADHPDADLAWLEPNKRRLARDAGIPDDVPIETIAFTGDWERFFRPKTDDTNAWFCAMTSACEAMGGPENAPSAWMFGKAVASGILFKRDGWEAFDRFMSEPRDEIRN